MRTLLEEIRPQNTSLEDFVVEHNFPRLGCRKMTLEARRLTLKGGRQHLISLAIADLTAPE